MVIFKSNFADMVVSRQTLPEFLLDRDMPDRPYISDAITGTSHSFKDIRSLSMRFGQGLVEKLKWKKNDVLCVFSPNVIDFPVILFGTLLAAGTVTPANPSYTTKELVHQLKDSGARACVIHPALLSVALPAAKEVGIPSDAIFTFSSDDTQGARPWRSLLPNEEIGFSRMSSIDPAHDLAYLVYSSGTTGLAKGVMLSHTNIVSNIQSNYDFDGKELVPGKDVMGAILPFYHIFGLTCIVQQCLRQQVQIVVHQAFDLARFLQSVEQYKIR